MTAVCSVGLDMIVVPGDTPAEVISAIIADEAAIGMVNSKTTAVRLIPAIGKKVGEELELRRPARLRPGYGGQYRMPRPCSSTAAAASPPRCRALKTKKHKIQFFVHTILGEQSVLSLFSEDFLSPAFDFRHRSGARRMQKGAEYMLDVIALILTVIGGINWGLIGIFQFDLVAWLFGGQGAVLSRIIYTLVGIAAVWCISLLFRDNDLIEK